MNEVELQELFERTEFKARVKAALRHWAYHWRVTKAAELEALMPESYKKQRKAMIAFIFNEPDRATEMVANMVIGDPDIKALTCYHMVTADKIKISVDTLLSRSVVWFIPANYLAEQNDPASNS